MTLTSFQSCRNPTVNILKSRAIRDFNAPVVASFSACGPNQILAEIMKVKKGQVLNHGTFFTFTLIHPLHDAEMQCSQM